MDTTSIGAMHRMGVVVHAGQHLDSIFELNPGNHFQDPAGRVAKGIAWLLRA